MTLRTKTRLSDLALVVSFTLLFAPLPSCAGHESPQMVTLRVAESSQATLVAIADLEAGLCWNVATKVQAQVEADAKRLDLMKCSSPVAALVKLTDVNHQKFNSALAKAFDAHAAMSEDMRTWSTGLPPPGSVTTYAQAAQQALDLAKLLASDNPKVAILLADIQALADGANQILAAIKGGR